jgi:hypothetical protein
MHLFTYQHFWLYDFACKQLLAFQNTTTLYFTQHAMCLVYSLYTTIRLYLEAV